ncbi:MAG: hypothetical protein FRX49_10538 [Trebouxia sp. A1-2]|nr:MAG: hypothetical protein FRX49_10538 [Trebouxia sp. A1-2]
MFKPLIKRRVTASFWLAADAGPGVGAPELGEVEDTGLLSRTLQLGWRLTRLPCLVTKVKIPLRASIPTSPPSSRHRVKKSDSSKGLGICTNTFFSRSEGRGSVKSPNQASLHKMTHTEGLTWLLSDCESTPSTNTNQQLLIALLPSLAGHQNMGSKVRNWCCSNLGLGGRDSRWQYFDCASMYNIMRSPASIDAQSDSVGLPQKHLQV